MYTVTRQMQWPEGNPVVEISSGGIDYCNPDALVAKYEGEFCEYDDPREAVKVAVGIVRGWRKDGEKRAMLGIGATGGMTMPFDTSTFKEASEWAEKRYVSLKKCPCCNEILKEKQELWSSGFITKNGDFLSDDEYIYCSERCAEKNNVEEGE